MGDIMPALERSVHAALTLYMTILPFMKDALIVRFSTSSDGALVNELPTNDWRMAATSTQLM